MHGAAMLDSEVWVVRFSRLSETEIRLQGAFKVKFPTGNLEIATSQ